MKVYLAITLAGIFLLDEDRNIIGVQYFKLRPSEVAEKIIKLNQGILIQELSEILKEYKKADVYLQNPTLGRTLSAEGFNIVGNYDNTIIDNFHKNFIKYAVDNGLFTNNSAYRNFIRESMIQITREKVRQAAEKRDRLVVHAIETIDDIDKTLNLFSGRLREFYGMHFPELVDAIDNHFSFAIIVSKTGDKSQITKELLIDEIKLPKNKAEILLDARGNSMGSPLLEQDITIIKDQAKLVVDLYLRRQALEKWMEETMKTVAPNICGVINPLIGARLIALAGGLRDLALCPSSKLQVLGAEKALYRTIKTGAPPPKHGIIFQDPRLNQAKWWQRGKIARVLSGKLSIAARMDYFEAEDKSEELAREVNEKIEEIYEKYPEPPEKKKTPIRKVPVQRTQQKRPPPGKYKSGGGKQQKKGSNKRR